MRQLRRRATWTGAFLGAFAALLTLALQAHASAWEGSETEEFHQTYPLSANGRIQLDNINGPAHIKAWDREEVKVDAIKRAGSKERLQEAKIKIEASKDSISIRTEYPDHDHTFWKDNRHDDPASVEYTLTVPRNARLAEVNLVNGNLDVEGVAGEVHASCVNGKLTAVNLGGRTELSTVNGRLEASLENLASPVEVSSVNASVLLTLPSDAKADVEASTVSGSISNDFGIPVSHHRFVGHEMRGELGGGGADVRVSNVNGRIEIRHANDNRPLSPAKNLTRDGDDKDRDDQDEDTI
jgi:putative adhesin